MFVLRQHGRGALFFAVTMVLLPGLHSLAQQPLPGGTPASTAAPQPPASIASPADQAELSLKAYKLLQTGRRLVTLAGDEVAPWHMKVDYTMQAPYWEKPITGTLEEWSAGPYRWRRNYTSREDYWSGTEWSLSRLERYRSSTGTFPFGHSLLDARIARMVTDPLYQAVHIQPDFEMTWKRLNAGVMLNCVYVVDPVRYSGGIDPDNLFVKSCFDDHALVRVTSSADTAVQFGGYEVFRNVAVARSIKVLRRGKLIADIKVTLLEPWSPRDADPLLIPPKNAVFQPYERQIGDPKLVPVYQVGAVIPFSPDNRHYRGYANVPVVIQKDGTVKVLPTGTMPGTRPVLDVIEDAMRKWKYRPYVIDGQTIDVETTLRYQIDGTPFVPEYERTNIPVVTAPEDFTSTYDPKRDPVADLELAKAQANKSKKNIFIEVGGDWCIWCTRMDEFLKKHQNVNDLLAANYVVMKVNMSDANENKTFLGQLPEIDGYPHIFILDSGGKLLVSESTDALITSVDSYNPKLFTGFLERWKVR